MLKKNAWLYSINKYVYSLAQKQFEFSSQFQHSRQLHRGGIFMKVTCLCFVMAKLLIFKGMATWVTGCLQGITTVWDRSTPHSSTTPNLFSKYCLLAPKKTMWWWLKCQTGGFKTGACKPMGDTSMIYTVYGCSPCFVKSKFTLFFLCISMIKKNFACWLHMLNSVILTSIVYDES